MTISRNLARRFAAEAAKSGATVLGGQLLKEADRYLINKVDVTERLNELLTQNVLFFVGPVEDDVEDEVKTCLTCGDEYTEAECPHCANVRSRLRG